VKRVEHYVRAYAMRLLDDGRCVIDVGAAEQNVGNRNDQGLLVDSLQQAFRGHADSVGLHHLHPSPQRPLRFPEIHYRRKVHVAVNDLVPASGEIEARCDHCLAGRDVLMSGDRRLRSVD